MPKTPLISRNKSYGKPFSATKFRRIALGSWDSPTDPTIYGVLELNIEKALKVIEQKAKESGERITITHFVGKVLAEVLKKNPQMNCELRFGRFYPRSTIDVSFQVAIEAKDETEGSANEYKHDLSAGSVKSADQKSIAEIARELNQSARNIRNHKDPQFGGIKKLSFAIPGILLRPAVRLLQLILSTLNLWSPLLGIPKNAFGSILITNVGSLGIDFALPALFPPAGVSCILAVGAIYHAPVYETNEEGVVIKTRLERHVRLCGAFDHRFIDGLHASRFAREIRRLFEHPEQLA